MAETRKPGWWYPYIFVGCFVVVVGVNSVLAYFATSTFTGLQTTGAYEKGLAYNQNLAMAEAQARMGWTVDTKAEPVKDAGGPMADIAISYRDKDGKPVEGLVVRASLVRPTVKGHDHDVELKPLGKGVYGLRHPLPLAGVWDMDVVAVGKDVSYQHEKRFVVP